MPNNDSFQHVTYNAADDPIEALEEALRELEDTYAEILAADCDIIALNSIHQRILSLKKILEERKRQLPG